MQTLKANEQLKGVAAAVGAYGMWGILPMYWKLLKVPADEILAHRILWSFLLMVAIILVTKNYRPVIDDWRALMANVKRRTAMVAASLLISVNWLTYIWAVNDNRIVETSFGYYINPLVSVLLGIVVLKEKLSFWQMVSFIIAFGGVLNMSLNFGSVPWVALVLAITFGLYGLCKKMVNVGAVTSITIETLLVTPIALVYISFIEQQGNGAFTNDFTQAVLLAGAGIVTAIPLMLFASSANRLPLAILGFTQYLSPTITLVVGVFYYHEPFTHTHVISFGLIWLALTVFSLARTRPFIAVENLIKKVFKQHGIVRRGAEK